MEEIIEQRCLLKKPEPFERFRPPSPDSTVFLKPLQTETGTAANQSVWASNQLVRFNSAQESVPCRLAPGSIVVDSTALVMQNGAIGVVIALRYDLNEDSMDESDVMPRHAHSILLFLQDGDGQYVHVRTAVVASPVTKVFVVLSEPEMKTSRASGLAGRMSEWPHVIAVGCGEGRAYIGSFPPCDADDPADWGHEEQKMEIDTLKSLKQGRSFLIEDTHEAPLKDVSVSSLAYIPRWNTLVIGMNYGGLVMIPLDGRSTILELPISKTSPVAFVNVMEPENDLDENQFIYIWVSLQWQRPLSFLYRCGRWARPKEYPDEEPHYTMSHQEVAAFHPEDGSRWVSVQTLGRKRAGKDPSTSHEASSLLGQSIESDGYDRTLLFYAYYSARRNSIQGGIFDLNTFYSKRCAVGRIQLNKLRQHIVLSSFTLGGQGELVPSEVQAVQCHSVSPFTSLVFDAEPLFSPMTFHLSLRIFTQSAIFEGAVLPLQMEVLSHVAGDLSCLKSPANAVFYLTAVGLIDDHSRKTIDDKDNRIDWEVSAILRAVTSSVDYRRHFLRFLRKEADRRTRLILGRWMWREVKETVGRMDEALPTLFEGVAVELLSRAAIRHLEFCPLLYRTASLVFECLAARGARLMDDTPQLRAGRKMHARAAAALEAFIWSAVWLTKQLPCGDAWAKLNETVAELIQEKRLRATAARNGRTLFIDTLLVRVFSSSDDDPLWTELGPTEWYPPALYNLVSVLRLPGPSMADRASLLLYFLLDADEAAKRQERIPACTLPGASYASAFEWSDAGESLALPSTLFADVRRQWKEDMGKTAANQDPAAAIAPAVPAPAPVATESRLTAAEKEELQRLIDLPLLRLPTQEEQRLKELLLKMNHGKYRWNFYLIKKQRYFEVEDLPVPASDEECPHKAVKDYANFKEYAMRAKQQLPGQPWIARTVAAQVSSPACSPLRRPLEPHLFKNVTIQRAKTPKKLGVPIQRLRDVTERASVDDSQMEASISMEEERRREDAMDDAELADEHARHAPDEAAGIRDVLRTPRARAKQAIWSRFGCPSGLRRTPENAGQAPAPTSILKSAKKNEASVAKGRLRFAPDSHLEEQKTISPRSFHDHSQRAPLKKLNFDDDSEELEESGSATTETSVNDEPSLEILSSMDGEQGDGEPSPSGSSAASSSSSLVLHSSPQQQESFAVYESDGSARRSVEVLEKSLEVQDEEDEEEVAAVPEEVQEEENNEESERIMEEKETEAREVEGEMEEQKGIDEEESEQSAEKEEVVDNQVVATMEEEGEDDVWEEAEEAVTEEAAETVAEESAEAVAESMADTVAEESPSSTAPHANATFVICQASVLIVEESTEPLAVSPEIVAEEESVVVAPDATFVIPREADAPSMSPGAKSRSPTNSSRVDDDGIERSFEQQEEEDGEVYGEMEEEKMEEETVESHEEKKDEPVLAALDEKEDEEDDELVLELPESPSNDAPSGSASRKRKSLRDEGGEGKRQRTTSRNLEAEVVVEDAPPAEREAVEEVAMEAEEEEEVGIQPIPARESQPSPVKVAHQEPAFTPRRSERKKSSSVTREVEEEKKSAVKKPVARRRLASENVLGVTPSDTSSTSRRSRIASESTLTWKEQQEEKLAELRRKQAEEEAEEQRSAIKAAAKRPKAPKAKAKNLFESIPEGEEDETKEEVPVVVKKKVGRPPKQPKKEEETPKKQAPTKITRVTKSLSRATSEARDEEELPAVALTPSRVTRASSHVASEISAEPSTPHSTRRTRTASTAARDNSAPAAAITADAAAAATPAETPRKRGRPRKVPLEEGVQPSPARVTRSVSRAGSEAKDLPGTSKATTDPIDVPSTPAMKKRGAKAAKLEPEIPARVTRSASRAPSLAGSDTGAPRSPLRKRTTSTASSTTK